MHARMHACAHARTHARTHECKHVRLQGFQNQKLGTA
jgi:hypothetical protein